MKDFYRMYKSYILGAAIVVLLFAAYVFLFQGNDTGPALQTEQNGPEEAVEEELLATLLSLRSIELDEGIFSDETFQSLRDFSQTISPQPVGRNNPFAPLVVN